jgi:hypothetical protein
MRAGDQVIFSKTPPAKLTVMLARMDGTAATVIASQEFEVPMDWSSITASFTVTELGQYKPIFVHQGLSWMGTAANVKTLPREVKWKTSMKTG